MNKISITIPANTEIVRSVFERNRISAVIFNVGQEAKSVEHYKRMSSEMGMDPDRLKVHIEKKKRFLQTELDGIRELVGIYHELWMDKYVHLTNKVKAL